MELCPEPNGALRCGPWGSRARRRRRPVPSRTGWPGRPAAGWTCSTTGSAGSRSAPSRPATASDAERLRWFYTPTDHGGLTVHQQRPAQQRAAMRLVASGLSTAGVRHRGDRHGPGERARPRRGFVARFDRERGRDPGLYYLRVFGEPGGGAAVGLAVRRPPRLAEQPRRRRCGGRRPRRASSAPTRPCRRCSAAPSLRPLAQVEDLARDLVRSLPPSWPPARPARPGAVGPRHRQPHRDRRGRPGAYRWPDLARRASPTRTSRRSCRPRATRSSGRRV